MFFVIFLLFRLFIDFPAHCSQPLSHVASISLSIPRPSPLLPHVKSLRATQHSQVDEEIFRFFLWYSALALNCKSLAFFVTVNLIVGYFNMMKCIYQYHLSGQNFDVEMP